MSFSITTRFAVLRATITGGNISTKAASKILTSLSSVKEVPQSFIKALYKKADKHSYLQIRPQMAQALARKSDTLLQNGVNAEQQKIEEQKALINNFGRKISTVVDQIFSSNKNFDIRARTVMALEKNYRINLSTNQRLRGDVAHQQYVKRCAVEQLDVVRKTLAKRPTRALCDEEQSLCKQIDKANEKISAIQQQIPQNRINIIKTIVNTARANKDIISSESRDFLQMYDKLVQDKDAAPAIIEQTQRNIEKLKDMQSTVKNYSEQLEHLRLMLAVAEVMKEANATANVVRTSNEDLRQSIVDTMNSDNAINDAIAQGTQPKLTRQNATLVLPSVPQHNLDVPAEKLQHNVVLNS